MIKKPIIPNIIKCISTFIQMTIKWPLKQVGFILYWYYIHSLVDAVIMTESTQQLEKNAIRLR